MLNTLMSDDEKMLIMHEVIGFGTQKALCVQNFIKLQVFSIKHSSAADCLGQWPGNFILGAIADF